MPPALNRTLLELCQPPPQNLKPGQAVELVRRMGNLARWWLRPEVLERVAQELNGCWDTPRLPTAAGTCWIIFAQEPPRWPALRDAFLLPLQWQSNTLDSLYLPAKLRGLARAVAQTVHHPDWGLHLSRDAGLEGMDLRELDDVLEVASGWASLAGGLLLAAEGGRPDPAVWATGAWNEDGIRRVSHLKAKVQLAVEYGVRQLFVPESQVSEAERLARQQPHSLSIGALAEGKSDPQEALRNYRDALDLPPLPTDPQESRRAYYLRQEDEERARQYYRDNLLPDIVQNLRAQWLEQNGGTATHLVTIASDNPELVSMAVGVVRPRTCLVLYTTDKAAKLAEVRQLLVGNKTECELIPKKYASPEELLEKMSGAIQEVVAGADPEGVLLDLTPGTKEMSLTLALEVAQAGNRLYYVRHQRKGSRVVPFSERLLVRRAGERGT